MVRKILCAAAMAACLGAPALAFAEPQTDVADAFITAARAQDRKAALSLLAADVSIEFPTGADLGRQGHGEGQAFVIGYLDGLFDSGRGMSLDSAAPLGDAVRFMAHENRSNDRYAIDVEIRNRQVVKVTVNRQDRAALAALAPAA